MATLFHGEKPTPPLPPEPPSNIRVTGTSLTSVSLTWDTVLGAAKYKIYRSSDGDNKYTPVGESEFNTYEATGLVAGTVYYFKVSSVNTHGKEGSLSSAFAQGETSDIPVRSRHFEFNSNADWSVPDEVNYPATIEIYALGGGGGGQGGNRDVSIGFLWIPITTQGTGGAGGGGAATYIKFNIESPPTFKITVGSGGTGGKGITTENDLKAGAKGSDGGDTKIKWSGYTLKAPGGKGGGLYRSSDSSTTRSNTTGGTGGMLSTWPPIELTIPLLSKDYGKGSNGTSGDVNTDKTSTGGAAGKLTKVGNPFTDNKKGVGGIGGRNKADGRGGGNGQVKIVVTWYEL